MAVDGGVDAEGEEVLMVGCHDAESDDGAVGDGVADVDGVGGKDACWADFVVDGGVLVEVEGEDAFVVADGDDRLQYQDSGSCDYGVLSAEAGMFLQNPVVDFVAANDIGQLDWIASTVVVPAIEILDMTERVTAKFQVIGIDASAIAAEVECSFARVRSPTVSVRHEHFGK